MRVAMVGLRGIPAQSGGIERAVEELSIRLAKRGCEVTVFCRNHYGSSRDAEHQGVRLRYLPAIVSKHLEAASHTALGAMCTAMEPFDLIHFHALGPGLFSWLPRLAGRRTVLTVHGLDWQRDKWGPLARSVLKLGERAACWLPDRTVVVSRALEAHYRDNYQKPVHYIPNGVTIPDTCRMDLPAEWGLEADRYLLFLGRLVPEKGLDSLISAFRTLSGSWKLAIAGEATHTTAYVAKLRLLADRDPRIRFLGPVYGEEKEALISNARLFVLPSHLEGLPIALLEAMAHGICPLASDIPVHKEVLFGPGGPFGFSFPVGDAHALARRLREILHDPAEIALRGQGARRLVEQSYRWDTVADQTLELYRSLLGPRPLPRTGRA